MISSNARLQTASEGEEEEACFSPIPMGIVVKEVNSLHQWIMDSLSADGLPILRKKYPQRTRIKEQNVLDPPSWPRKNVTLRICFADLEGYLLQGSLF